MNILEALILGIIQGLTEFLPVSSSGHLVLAQHFMNIHEKGVLLEVILHMGTLGSIIFYYYNDIKSLIIKAFNNIDNARSYIIYLIIATIPAACCGLLLDDFIENNFMPSIVSIMLFITGIAIASTYFFAGKKSKNISIQIAICIGLAQACALMPGISRSGLTISIALIIGIQHYEATKFSFFMAIPVLLGAGFLQFVKIINYNQIQILPLIIGFFSAFISGYLVINWLLAVISKGKFHIFSLYCFMIAIITYIFIN